MQNVLYFMVNHLSYDVQSYSFWPGGQALWFPPAEGQTDPWASQAELVAKSPPVSAGDQERQDQSLGWESPLEEGVQPTPGFLPGDSRGKRSLAGYSPEGLKELDATEAT